MCRTYFSFMNLKQQKIKNNSIFSTFYFFLTQATTKKFSNNCSFSKPRRQRLEDGRQLRVLRRLLVENVRVDVVHQTLVELVVQVGAVQLLQRNDLLLVRDPLQNELLVAGLAETEAVPVGLFPRKDPEKKGGIVKLKITPRWSSG